MTQLTINIEDKAFLPHLKKILSALNVVSIAQPSRVAGNVISNPIGFFFENRIIRL